MENFTLFENAKIQLHTTKVDGKRPILSPINNAARLWKLFFIYDRPRWVLDEDDKSLGHATVFGLFIALSKPFMI